MSKLFRWQRVVPVVLLLPVLVVVGLLGLLASERGTGWLVNAASPLLDDRIYWNRLEGTALTGVQLYDLHVRYDGGSAQIAHVNLAWSPATLLSGSVGVSRLHAEGIRINTQPAPAQTGSAGAVFDPNSLDTQASTEADFDPSSLQLPIGLTLTDVLIRDVEVAEAGSVVFSLHELILEKLTVNDEAVIEGLTLALPEARVGLEGRLSLASIMTVDLDVDVATSALTGGTMTEGAPVISGRMGISGSLSFTSGMSADLKVDATASGLAQLSADLPEEMSGTGDIGLKAEGDTLYLDKLALALEPAVSLEASGEIQGLSTAAPVVNVTANWANLRWPLRDDLPHVISPAGEITLQGSADDYRLAFTAEAEGQYAQQTIPPMRWQGAVSGSRERATLQNVEGRLLTGAVVINGDVAWLPNPAWQLQLAADSIDVQAYSPVAVTPVSGSFSTRGQLRDGQGALVDLTIQGLSTILEGRPITVDAVANLEGETLRMDVLQLSSGDNDLKINGSLSERAVALDWQLALRAPQTLLAELNGQLAGEGRLSGSMTSPELSAALSGRDIAFGTLSAGEIDLSMLVGPAPSSPLQVDLTAQKIADAGNPIAEALTFISSGSVGDHQLRLQLDTEPAVLSTELAGGFQLDQTEWTGDLQSLRATLSDYGLWQLRAPTALNLSPKRAMLELACFTGQQGDGDICLKGDWHDSQGSSVSTSIEHFDLGPFAEGLTGHVDGQMNASLAAGGALRAQGNLNLSSGSLTLPTGAETQTLSFGGGQLNLIVDEAGLKSDVKVMAPAEGSVDGRVSLPALTSLPLAEQQPVEGYIAAKLPDLAFIAGMSDIVDSLSGALMADVAIGGDLFSPDVEGTLALTDGTMSLPDAGLTIAGISLSASNSLENPAQLDINGQLVSGPGTLSLEGSLDLANQQAQALIKGQEIAVFNTPDARVFISPDITVTWQDELVDVRGSVFVPKAAITPQIQLMGGERPDDEVGASTNAAIVPSRDVVIVSPGRDQQTAPSAPTRAFAISATVDVAMGPDVTIDTLGLTSRIGGGARFTLTPSQTELIPDAQGVYYLSGGTFRSFGQDLNIETGQAIFTKVPATKPEILLRAVRWIDGDPQVTAAGVVVSGDATEPQFDLFSRPQLDDIEIQSYLLTGRGTGDVNSRVGFGKYVTKRIYVGYGYNLLEQTSEFNTLFSITPRYGIGADLGEADSNFNLIFTLEH